jgi:hypothetical protein
MMETLEEVKDRLKGGYLGKAGIHGLGISRAQGAIRVYISPGSGLDQTDVLEQRLCRKFCSGGYEGAVAPVYGGIKQRGSRTVWPQ